MKSVKLHVMIISCLFIVSAVLSLIGCEGKQGPAGPTGATGPAGDSGTALCGTCHSVSTEIVAKVVQWQASVHATGGNFARNGKDCAGCHTHEGFRERLVSGSLQTAATINNPTPQNCRTCHNIHTNYDRTDFNLSYSSPVSLLINGQTVDFGNGNLCAMCHQPRPVSPMPVVGGPDVEIKSSRWGGHHGPMAATLGGLASAAISGTGYYEISGSTPYENSPHTTMITDGCITCHMADAYGAQAGGHTMNMAYEYHGAITPNLAACRTCHTDITSFDVNGVQTEVEGLLETLKGKLETIGILTSSGLAKGTWSSLIAGSYLNYQMISEDRSKGVHNAKYVKALLKNTIEALP